MRYAEGQIWRSSCGERHVEIDMIKGGSIYYRVGAADGGLRDAVCMTIDIFDTSVRRAEMVLEWESEQ